MKNFKTVMLYTIKQSMMKKAFIISNLIMFLFVVLMFNLPNIMLFFNEDGDNKILIIDAENIFENALPSLNTMDLNFVFDIFNDKIEHEIINKKINNDEYITAAVLYEDNGQIKFDYIIKNVGQGLSPEVLKELFDKLYFNLGVSKLNLTEQELAKLNTEITYEAILSSGEEEPVFSASIIILSIGLFFAIYFYAFQVSSTVTMEKTSKVMETLVTSTNPRSIILGKTFGTAVLGMMQFGLLIIVGIICYKVFMPVDNPLDWLDFSNVTFMALVISFIYFILGYALFAFAYALVGSTVSKPEDIQTANAPVAMISMAGFYFGYFTVIFSPTSELTKIATLVPFSAPFSMPFRMMMVNVPLIEIIMSIIILIITIILVVHVAVKIYSVAILHYGSRITFKEMLKLYTRK